MVDNSRRDFFKTAGLMSTVLLAQPILSKADAKIFKDEKLITQYRTLGTGSAAMKVSSIGFGCMGLNYHRGPYPDKKFAINLMHQAVDEGYTLFDTAESYGPFSNEILVGEGLSKIHKSGKIKITSKFGHDYDYLTGKSTGKRNSKPKHIKYVAEQSLKRLNIDCLDMFYQHRADPEVPIEDVVGTLKELIDDGKIKRYGLCEVNADTIRRANKVYPITAIQSEYHLMFRAVEKEILQLCQKLGIGFVPYSPINRGMLGGQLNEFTNFNNISDNRKDLPRFQHEALRQNMKFVEAVIEFGRTRGMTPAQVSLAWLLAKAPFIVPIPGTTKPAHMTENIHATDFVFSEKDVSELETILSQISVVGDRYPAYLQQQVGK